MYNPISEWLGSRDSDPDSMIQTTDVDGDGRNDSLFCLSGGATWAAPSAPFPPLVDWSDQLKMTTPLNGAFSGVSDQYGHGQCNRTHDPDFDHEGQDEAQPTVSMGRLIP